jgi:uncharacterized membrane protein YphA (DoxX/SURF4 family)
MHNEEHLDNHGHRDSCEARDAHGRRRLAPFVFHGLRLLLGAVFVVASYDKILHPQAFAQAIYNYQILPDGLVNLAALILPWLELLLGLCLVAGFWLPGATVLSTGLLAVFSGALVFNLIRGLDVHCGCFSTDSTDGPAGLWTVARDLGFLAVALVLTLRVLLGRSISWQSSTVRKVSHCEKHS